MASALLLAVTAAYALSRVRFQGRSLLLLTTFMRELPVEIEEAAIVDGASA